MAVTTATASGGTRAWSDIATWDTGVVPTAADDVVLDAASGNVTIAAAAVARSLNCTGYVGVLTHNTGITLTLGDATAGTGNAALTLAVGMTYTLGNASSSALAFVSTSTTQQAVVSAGKTCGNMTFNGTAGTWLLSGALTCATITVNAGTLTTGSQTVTCSAITVSGATAVMAFGTSTINYTATGAVNVLLRSSGGTLTAGAATFNITTASSSTRGFFPVSTALSQSTLNYTVPNSAGTLSFSGALDLAALNISDGVAANRNIQFPSAATYTLRAVSIQGAPGATISIISSSVGSAATLTKPSRVVSCDYVSIRDITATGGASWYAGANSTNVSGNTGWMFTAPSNYQFLQFA
jgi:hypothetical protein